MARSAAFDSAHKVFQIINDLTIALAPEIQRSVYKLSMTKAPSDTTPLS